MNHQETDLVRGSCGSDPDQPISPHNFDADPENPKILYHNEEFPEVPEGGNVQVGGSSASGGADAAGGSGEILHGY